MFIFSTIAWGLDIRDRIETQNYFLSVYPYLFGKAEYSFKPQFKELFAEQSRSKRKDALLLVKGLEKSIPERILMPLVYWRVFKQNKQAAAEVIKYLALYKLMILRDFIDNPLNNSAQKAEVKKYLQRLGMVDVDTFKVFNFFQQKVVEDVMMLSYLDDMRTLVGKIKKHSLLGDATFKALPFLPKYSLTKLGLIRGNQVKLFSHNVRSQARIDWYNQRVVFHGGKMDWSNSYMKMPMNPEEVGHIAFKTDPIFMQIRDMIHRAQDSIFIDIFLFGGTLGGTIAKYLLDETAKKIEKNPNFKVLLLHDYATNYNMYDEMMPVFFYIRDRINQEKIFHDHFYFLQANIQRHPPGIPFGLTNHIPKTPALFSVVEKRSTYYESKIDHSKVLVIDANTDHPEAYFGSKNWSDHSGGYYYDNVIWIKGPAAALVQASYYDDVQAALTTDKKEMAWFYYKDKGLDNRRYLSKRNEILEWFKIKKNNYPEVGNDTVRFAEANVDGRIKNVRNILVDMIAKAEDHIYMEQLFIYDKYIADALIKRKLQQPELDIRILADHNGNFGMNGFPNTIFMQELIDAGIKIRARDTLGITAYFPDGHEQKYHQENHRKITSVDGKVILGGSSNLNPDTLQGSFREFGAQFFNQEEIAKFEHQFLVDWSDQDKTSAAEIDEFELKLGDKVLDHRTSDIINKFVGLLYRSKDYLEKRH